MVAIHQTAYLRLKKDLKPEEFGDEYTPTTKENDLRGVIHSELAAPIWVW